MKNVLTVLILIFSISVLGQTHELKIDGIAADVENSLLKGDMISYYGNYGTNGKYQHKNLKVKINNVGDYKTESFFKSVDLKADETGHYNLKEVVEIKGSSRVDITKDIEITVYLKTIYGNAIWAKETRTPSTITEPILLNQYTEKEGKDYPPKNELTVDFTSKPNDDAIKKRIEENGDSYKKRKKENYHFFLKNVGDKDWVLDVLAPFGSITSGMGMKANIKNPDKLDMSNNVIVRAEITTEKGNLLWSEVEFEPRMICRPTPSMNYVVAGETQPSNNLGTVNTPDDKANSDVETNTDDNKGDTEEKEVKIVPEVKPVPTIVHTGATDLTTHTLEAKCNNTDTTHLLVT